MRGLHSSPTYLDVTPSFTPLPAGSTATFGVKPGTCLIGSQEIIQLLPIVSKRVTHLGKGSVRERRKASNVESSHTLLPSCELCHCCGCLGSIPEGPLEGDIQTAPQCYLPGSRKGKHLPMRDHPPLVKGCPVRC